jgi:hypothetical protein
MNTTNVNADGFSPGMLTFNNGVTCTAATGGGVCAMGQNVSLPSPLTLDFANLTPTELTSLGTQQVFFAVDVFTGGANGSTGWLDYHAVPAPIIGHGFLALLAIGGVLAGGKLLEDLKKRHLQAA